MNKKSQMFSILLVLMFIAVMLTAFVVIAKASANRELFIGPKQNQVLGAYEEGENHLFYLDTAVKVASQKALYNFEINGHFTGLGKAENYYLWKAEDKKYAPTKESTNENFIQLFAGEIGKYFPGNFSEADFYVDIDKGTIIGRPLWPETISSDNLTYAVQENFAEKISDFDYTSILNLINEFDMDCSEQEWHNVVQTENALLKCIKEKINKNERLKLSDDCEQDEALTLNKFAEEYNECADSFDYDCRCELSNIDEIQIETIDGKTTAKLGEQNIALNRPYSGALQKIVYKAETRLEPATKQYPKCRINKRTFKICFDHNKSFLINNEFKHLYTKFATIVDDKTAPPAVEASVTGNLVSWKPSPAPDVKRYRVYAVQKGTPFVEDEFISIERTDYKNQFKNIDQTFTYNSPKDLTNFNVKVIAEDFSGNFISP